MASLRCLVTGGAGFVGSHLVDRLLADGHRVLALDCFVTGSRDNLAHLAAEPRFDLVEHDVTLPFPDLGTFERVFNLACPASPPRYQADPVFTLRTCVEGALRALRLAQAQGARVLHASTSEVYGDPEVHPQHEGYRGSVNPIGPRACYDEGKRAAETLCADFRRAHGVDVRMARIFNTYGPRMDLLDGRVVSNFAVQAIRGEPLTVYGEGTQTRSFCYVSDLVDGLARLAAHEGADAPFVVNLGNDGEYTMLELARLVLATAGSASELSHRPLPADDPVRRRPDLSLARRVLGYEPRVSLAEGLAPTVAWFEARLGAAAKETA